MEEARTSSHRLGRGIAGDPFEGFVREDDFRSRFLDDEASVRRKMSFRFEMQVLTRASLCFASMRSVRSRMLHWMTFLSPA